MDCGIALSVFIPAIVTYYVSLVFYRLFFHSLARFPGPKLAAISRWYEAYYDVALKGQYTRKIADLHRLYGMAFVHLNCSRYLNAATSRLTLPIIRSYRPDQPARTSCPRPGILWDTISYGRALEQVLMDIRCIRCQIVHGFWLRCVC